MRKLLLAFCAFATICSAGAQWKPAGDKIKTDWAEKVDPRNVLPEYPRPGMERADWQNLNGEWEYAILPKGQAEPTSFDGNILVPFAVESSLSGVQKEVGEKNELWYKRTFTVPSSWKGKDILLNFGAVDWKADVFVNDILIGSHTGGFTPFSLNITPYLNGISWWCVYGTRAIKATSPVESKWPTRRESGIRRSPESGRPYGWSRSLPRISPLSRRSRISIMA